MSCFNFYLFQVPILVLFNHGLTALVGLGRLIFDASWSNSDMDYTGLLYTLVASEFTSSFQTRWRLNLKEWRRSLLNFTCYSLA